jgi:23S rRNA pseudouridine1911/1915/1917 synthase
VHPGAGVRSGTLQNALLQLDPELARVPRAGIVHRLDKDTSGLLVVARTPAAQARLVKALAARDIEREYLALCQGRVTAGGTVDEPLGRHRTQRTKMAVRPDGREAITHYRIERRFRAHTLLRVQLETGRTHQIRVHLQHIHHPIVGDPLYGFFGSDKPLNPPRILLHASNLELIHPHTKKLLSFSSPLPPDFSLFLERMGFDTSGFQDPIC